MIFIVDTNIIFAGLLRDSVTRALQENFEKLFYLITENILVIEKKYYENYIKDAQDLIGKKDPGDVPFLALALSTANDGIWTQNIFCKIK